MPLAPGSITIIEGAASWRHVAAGNDRRGRGSYRIEQFPAGKEHHAGAREGQHHSAPAGILMEIDLAAIDRAERDRVDNQPRLKARLDDEQPADLAPHGLH